MNEKPFYTSVTFWGVVITALSQLGAQIPGGTEGLADQIVGVVEAAGTVVGLLLALWGRFRARTTLTLT